MADSPDKAADLTGVLQVEVTSEMVEAARAVLLEYGLVDHDNLIFPEMVREALEAALGARRSHSIARAARHEHG